MHLTYSSRLAIALMAVVLMAFIVLHQTLHRLPWTDAAPRERFRWPVWSWYPLLILFGLLLGLGANILYMQRPSIPDHLPTTDRASELELQRGHEKPPAPAPSATPAP